MPTENIDYTNKTTGDNFTAADANDIKSAVNTNAGLQLINAPVEAALPALDASKAGELFYYNGTLWTYAKTGQFGTLAEGTPWPVKGYKELLFKFWGSTTISIYEFINEIKPISISLVNGGFYRIDDTYFEKEGIFVQVSPGSIEESVLYSGNIDFNQLYGNGLTFFCRSQQGNPVGITGEHQAMMVRILEYPPQS